MSGIDEGMMPEHVQPQHPDDDKAAESIVRPHTVDTAEDDDESERPDGAHDHSSTRD